MELIEEFMKVIDSLQTDGVEHAVCGGIAVAIHGHPRATRDIDLLLPARSLDAALRAVRRAGYILEGGLITFGGGTDRERRLFRVSRASGADLMTLDLLLVDDTNDPIWAERESVRWRGRELVVVSRAGLIEMKRRASRPQDLADIDHLSTEGGERSTVTNPRRSDIPEDVVAKRLADLADVDRLMRALREVRFPGDRVQEKPAEPGPGWDAKREDSSKDPS